MKTKIFISSVNEDGLKPLRKEVFRELSSLGHAPMMWEENFGPWTANIDPLAKCLELVEESDIFLLFLKGKAGTFQQQAVRTNTHMEFIKAFEQGKTILVFCDTEVKHTFFSIVEPFIECFVEQFLQETEQSPSPRDIMKALEHHDKIPRHVESYVWYFLYDISSRRVYIDDLSLGVPIDWKSYFSDLLRRGSILLPLEQSIQHNNARLEQYDEAYDVFIQLVPHLHISGFRDLEFFLTIIMSSFSGGIIEQSYGHYMSEPVGKYGRCSAVTLYVRNGDQLVLLSKIGDALGKESYGLNDKNSFVAITYNMGEHAEQIYYKEARQMFYYSIRSNQYVITLHFPTEANWDNKKFILFKESVNNAIMSKSPLIVEFIKLILGGMQS